MARGVYEKQDRSEPLTALFFRHALFFRYASCPGPHPRRRQRFRCRPRRKSTRRLADLRLSGAEPARPHGAGAARRLPDAAVLRLGSGSGHADPDSPPHRGRNVAHTGGGGRPELPALQRPLRAGRPPEGAATRQTRRTGVQPEWRSALCEQGGRGHAGTAAGCGPGTLHQRRSAARLHRLAGGRP